MENQKMASGTSIDLSRAGLFVMPGADALVSMAARVIVEEVEKRARIRWREIQALPGGDDPLIFLGTAAVAGNLLEYSGRPGPWLEWVADGRQGPAEGFQIHMVNTGRSTGIYILGNDPRGALFGAGYLLRRVEMDIGRVSLPGELEITTAPKYPLRGHQLGYRDKTNSYCGWDLPQWDEYIRELAIFGTNAIELIPPRSDDLPDSVHFPLPPLQMMAGMSGIADSYGLDVWIWYPAMDDDYSRPEMVEFALREWEQVYQALPRIDAILVPGGDPGNTRPMFLLPMLEKQTALLKHYHPDAQMWVSAQGFNREWMEEFLTFLRANNPEWLAGVVYGPWIHMTIAEFRKLIPGCYPIRNYPDITHSLDCQYPVPDWDLAYALTEGRETINPRPQGDRIFFNQMGEDTIGFICYSEGCNDDVNKFVWSGLGWDPRIDVVEILRQYSRFFIGPGYAHDFAQGLLALEQNWVGPLATNLGVDQTLARFQAMEKRASPALLRNWRFQLALYRAYYDAYIRSRLLYETSLEEQALDTLRQADRLGSGLAMEQAEARLDWAELQPVSTEMRSRVFQLAEALFQSIHMQLSVPLYYAQSEVRGANLDALDYPLNDRLWLEDQFECIRSLAGEAERLDAIRKLVGWSDAGPGGYYLDLSNAYHCSFLVQAGSYEADPGFFHTPHRRFPYTKDPSPTRRSWRGFTGTLGETPFRLRFPLLDPGAQYRLRVVYSDTEEDIKIRLVANETVEIHPYICKPVPRAPLEFDIPREATCTGELRLELSREPGVGGLGAGPEISELWIFKKE